MQPSGASRAALKRSREKEAALLAKGEAKRARARELISKMHDMEQSGALTCLTSIENYMRKNCLRIIDLFSKMDASGDGGVTAEELRAGLKKCGLKMKRKDVVLFVRYIDLDGTGEVGMEELEAAMRELRRFNWEKNTVMKLIESSGAPLPLRCRDMIHLWRPSSSIDGVLMLSAADVASGLMRMRGDGEDWLWEKCVPRRVRRTTKRQLNSPRIRAQVQDPREHRVQAGGEQPGGEPGREQDGEQGREQAGDQGQQTGEQDGRLPAGEPGRSGQPLGSFLEARCESRLGGAHGPHGQQLVRIGELGQDLSHQRSGRHVRALPAEHDLDGAHGHVPAHLGRGDGRARHGKLDVGGEAAGEPQNQGQHSQADEEGAREQGQVQALHGAPHRRSSDLHPRAALTSNTSS